MSPEHILPANALVASLALIGVFAIGLALGIVFRRSIPAILASGSFGIPILAIPILIGEEVIFPGIAVARGTNMDGAIGALLGALMYSTLSLWAGLLVGLTVSIRKKT